MLKCPGCDVEHDESHYALQAHHMATQHPEIIDQRMREAGFVQDPHSGKWVDCWASDG